MAKPREQYNQEFLIVPDPGIPSQMVLIARDGKKGGLGIYTSLDGGKTFQTMIPAPTGDDREGSILTLDGKGNAVWKPVRSPQFVSSGERFFVSVPLVGDLSPDAAFGYFKVPSTGSVILREIQLCLQDAADDDVRIDIVNGSGAEQKRIATLSASSNHSTTILSSPLTMNRGTVWSFKVLQCGSEAAPGQNLTLQAGIEYLSS